MFLFISVSAQPAERDYMKYRQEKLEAFLKSLEPSSNPIKTERTPEQFQLEEKTKIGFSLPEKGNWFNTIFPPALKEQNEVQSTVVIFDLFDLKSEDFISDFNERFGNFKNLKIRGIVKTPSSDLDNEIIIKRLQKIKPPFPFVLVDNFKTLNGIDTMSVPSAVLVNTGMQASIQIKSIEDITEFETLCKKLETIVTGRDSKQKGAAFSPDPRLIRSPESILYYPMATEPGPENTLYVSDAGNNRVLVLNQQGDVINVFGKRKGGFKDGSIEETLFNHPTGLAYDSEKNCLYVADEHNHCIRKVDLSAGRVSTVIGTGIPGSKIPEFVSATTGAISFPSSIEIYEDNLYIAMSGFNQIWVLDLKSNIAKPLNSQASKKKKKKKKESVSPETAFIPTGLSVSSAKSVIIADAFNGAAIEVGGKENKVIFDSKSDNKKGIEGLYEVAEAGGKLYFTDPLNHSLWVKDDESFKKIIGDNGPGLKNGGPSTAQLYFPTGLSAKGNLLFISDSFNDVIRIFDVIKNEVSTVALGDYDKAVSDQRNPSGLDGVIYGEPLTVSENSLVTIQLILPENLIINAYKSNRIEMMTLAGVEFSGADFELNLIEFQVQSAENNRQLYFEIELHLSDINNPSRIYYRTCRVMIPLEFDTSVKRDTTTKIKLFPLITE